MHPGLNAAWFGLSAYFYEIDIAFRVRILLAIIKWIKYRTYKGFVTAFLGRPSYYSIMDALGRLSSPL